MIQVDNAFAVAAPPEAVFDALSDAETVIRCLPGTRVVGAVDARNVLGQARVAFGRNTISYRGSIHVTGDDRSAQRISFRVRGREVRGDGVVEAIVDVVLRDARENGTVATVRADATITGRAGFLRPEVVESSAHTLLRRFGEALAERLGANPVTKGAPPAETDEELETALAEAPGVVPEESDTPATATATAAGSGAPWARRPTADDEAHTEDDVRIEAGQTARAVAGEVRLVTDHPVQIPSSPPGPVPSVARELERRPWLAPAVLMGILMAILLLRRRR